MGNETLVTLVLLAVGILLAILLGIRVHRQTAELVKKAKAQLEAKGYVVDHSYMRPIGEITRIWARYPQPISLYLQASNFDPVSVAAGHLGVADIKVGQMDFDATFVVRSNAPALVSQVLDTEIRTELLKHQKVRFRTGSIFNLLGADYFSEEKERRELRCVWMIEKSGKLSEEECNELLTLGRKIAAKAERFGTIPGKSLQAAFFEGR